MKTERYPIEVVGLDIGRGETALPEAAARAEVLAGGARLLERFPHAMGERVVLASPLSDALDAIERAWAEGRRVAVLADGDPLFFGIGARLLERFGPGRLRFTPGVTAVQAACARLGLIWHDLPVVSLHGRGDTAPLLRALARSRRAAVYTDHVNTPALIARLLLERGLEDATVHVLEDLGGPGERSGSHSLDEAASMEYSPLNIVVVQAAPGPRPVLGRPDCFYETEAGLITKWPMRAMAIAALRLEPGSLLWDVGAGSGAVAIEASALTPEGLVFAVEKDPGRCAAIRRNIRRCGALLVSLVEGEAPSALAGLPDPDRVFLGGSLGSGGEALAECCRRLRPGGRVVASTVLLGSLDKALAHFRSLGWPAEVVQAQAALSAPLAGDLRLAGANPVFLVVADKPS